MGTQGVGGKLLATMDVDEPCEASSYSPSELEQNFSDHILQWTQDQEALCNHLQARSTWIEENIQGQSNSATTIFSTLCRQGKKPERLEPLAGILRDPRMACDGTDNAISFSID